MPTYPLAPQAVFHTIQGEGVMLGVPMVFVRFAGCPVNCDGCDTDYSLSSRVELPDLLRAISAAAVSSTRWVWLTGGEPTIHDLDALVPPLHSLGFRVALATAGINPVKLGAIYGGADFVSVSPHRLDATWVHRRGDQINIVPGLNGVRLADLDGIDCSGFAHKFVTPMWYGAADKMDGVAECAEFVRTHPDWRLGIQAHRFWRMP